MGGDPAAAMLILAEAIARYTDNGNGVPDGTVVEHDIRFIDRDGQPMPHEEWFMRIADDAYCQVRHSAYGTVIIESRWIGADPGDGLVFRTAVYDTEERLESMTHYTHTLTECNACHDSVLSKLRAAIRFAADLFGKIGLNVPGPEHQHVSDSKTDN